MLTIGERIRQRREELNMTQEELAHLVGYNSKSSVNKIELDGRNLVQSKIMAFASALNTTPGFLMGWENPVTTALLPGEAEALRSFRQLDSQDHGRALGYMERLLEEPKYQRKAGGAV